MDLDVKPQAFGLSPRLIKEALSELAINKLAGATSARPRPFSLWSHEPMPAGGGAGPVSDYTSWPGLTDRSYSGRHLAPATHADIDALPANGTCDPAAEGIGPVTALFARPQGAPMKTDRSSVLFAYFAQWFTDSFLRTASVDRRRNTSNHEIDLCQIYGLTEPAARALRAMQGGRLASRVVDGEELPDLLFEAGADGQLVPKARYATLPHVADGSLMRVLDMQNTDATRRAAIYATGLERGNSSLGYVTMSTLFLREHNRLCTGLQAANPGWDDERLFQTARLINIVLLLRIVIEDYINHIAGHDIFVFSNRFAERRDWYRTNWMAIEFDLLYRWHGLVPDSIRVGNVDYGPGDFQNNNPLLETIGLASFIDGASNQPAGKIGLFNTPRFLLPAECAAIKMGRDYRLQPFNAYRRQFGLEPIGSWSELTGDVETQNALQGLYGSIDRLEFVVGLFAEEARGGALFGELLNTMVASDAFTQALTNPVLSTNVYNAATLTDYGMAQIAETPTLAALVQRNVGDGIKASF